MNVAAEFPSHGDRHCPTLFASTHFFSFSFFYEYRTRENASFGICTQAVVYRFVFTYLRLGLLRCNSSVGFLGNSKLDAIAVSYFSDCHSYKENSSTCTNGNYQ